MRPGHSQAKGTSSALNECTFDGFTLSPPSFTNTCHHYHTTALLQSALKALVTDVHGALDIPAPVYMTNVQMLLDSVLPCYFGKVLDSIGREGKVKEGVRAPSGADGDGCNVSNNGYAVGS